MLNAALSWSEEQLQTVAPSDAVIRDLLLRNAAEHPGEVFVTFDAGEPWTRRGGLEIACAAANALRGFGVKQRSRVAILLPNGPGLLAAWLGAAMLGATAFPINTALRGSPLLHALRLADPAVLVIDDAFRDRVDELEELNVRCVSPADLASEDRSVPELEDEISLGDDQLLIMTSGTTGPSKLVRISYLYPYAAYRPILVSQGFTEKDVFLLDLPLCHVAACGYLYSSLVTRSGIHVRTRPDLNQYWEVLRDNGITGCVLISSMVQLLLSQDVRSAEHEHRLKFMLLAPVPGDVDAFKERFKIPTLLTAWGSTEMGVPVIGEVRSDVANGYCGQPRPGYEVRIVDDNDQDVPAGAIGEGIIRPALPLMMSLGYFGDDEATARAWRGGWFHTGDLVKFDDNGDVLFVNRAGDAIRRRGENVSAHEVETCVSTYPGISEVAAVPVESDTRVEHEIKVWIVASPGVDLKWEDLLEHCAKTMPHFMVPRYYELASDLPKSTSGKVQKNVLRERGNSADTWDCRAHGLGVTRRGLERLK